MWTKELTEAVMQPRMLYEASMLLKMSEDKIIGLGEFVIQRFFYNEEKGIHETVFENNFSLIEGQKSSKQNHIVRDDFEFLFLSGKSIEEADKEKIKKKFEEELKDKRNYARHIVKHVTDSYVETMQSRDSYLEEALAILPKSEIKIVSVPSAQKIFEQIKLSSQGKYAGLINIGPANGHLDISYKKYLRSYKN